LDVGPPPQNELFSSFQISRPNVPAVTTNKSQRQRQQAPTQPRTTVPVMNGQHQQPLQHIQPQGMVSPRMNQSQPSTPNVQTSPVVVNPMPSPTVTPTNAIDEAEAIEALGFMQRGEVQAQPNNHTVPQQPHLAPHQQNNQVYENNHGSSQQSFAPQQQHMPQSQQPHHMPPPHQQHMSQQSQQQQPHHMPPQPVPTLHNVVSTSPAMPQPVPTHQGSMMSPQMSNISSAPSDNSPVMNGSQQPMYGSYGQPYPNSNYPPQMMPPQQYQPMPNQASMPQQPVPSVPPSYGYHPSAQQQGPPQMVSPQPCYPPHQNNGPVNNGYQAPMTPNSQTQQSVHNSQMDMTSQNGSGGSVGPVNSQQPMMPPQPNYQQGPPQMMSAQPMMAPQNQPQYPPTMYYPPTQPPHHMPPPQNYGPPQHPGEQVPYQQYPYYPQDGPMMPPQPNYQGYPVQSQPSFDPYGYPVQQNYGVPPQPQYQVPPQPYTQPGYSYPYPPHYQMPPQQMVPPPQQGYVPQYVEQNNSPRVIQQQPQVSSNAQQIETNNTVDPQNVEKSENNQAPQKMVYQRMTKVIHAVRKSNPEKVESPTNLTKRERNDMDDSNSTPKKKTVIHTPCMPSSSNSVHKTPLKISDRE